MTEYDKNRVRELEYEVAKLKSHLEGTTPKPKKMVKKKSKKK